MTVGIYPRKELRERFEEKFIPEPNSGCWLWLAFVAGDGYGKFWEGGANQQAHRISYGLYKKDVPKELVLDHLCRNRQCVNPEHLEIVTDRENILRGIGPSAINAKKTHCKNGHKFTAENTYFHPKRPVRDCRVCRAESMISYIGRIS